ncbi:hypothetical protein [Embleya hyalina]|uniref:Uncharacterized protein n=1 Tax=Embleya hyalina TaxID=516124 RepID=A0A401Z3W0_9ACTN|nr:hypothetical protein [Embleya hyalina]GCE01532.1 hypothetical protein EHYA_09298 [Embleya hyalina]
MTSDKHRKKAARELATADGISYTAARRRLTTDTTDDPLGPAMLAGLVARCRAEFTAEQFADRLQRGGPKYAAYLVAGHQAAIEALEYALGHGVDAVDDGLAAVAASKGVPITPAVLAEALRRVRDHSLLFYDGSSVAEAAYWVADRYWMHKWNDALDRSGPGEYDRVVGPNVYRRMAVHEWMAPGHDFGPVPRP